MLSIRHFIFFTIILCNSVVFAGSKEAVKTINAYLTANVTSTNALPKLTMQLGIDFSVVLKMHPTADLCATTDGKKIALWDLNSNKLLKFITTNLGDDEHVVDFNFSNGNDIAIEIGLAEHTFGRSVVTEDSSYIVTTSIYGDHDTISADQMVYAIEYTEAIGSTRTILVNYSSDTRLALPNCKHFWFNPSVKGAYYFLDNEGFLWNEKGQSFQTKTGSANVTCLTFWKNSDTIILGYNNGEVTIVRDYPKRINNATMSTGLNRVSDIFCSEKHSFFTCVGENSEGFVPIQFHDLALFKTIFVPKHGNEELQIEDNLHWKYLDEKFPQIDYNAPGTWFSYHWDHFNNRLFIIYGKNKVFICDYTSTTFHKIRYPENFALTNLGLYDNGNRVITSNQLKKEFSARQLTATMDVKKVNQEEFSMKNFVELEGISTKRVTEIWFSEDNKQLFVGHGYSAEKYELDNLSKHKLYEPNDKEKSNRLNYCSNNDAYIGLHAWKVAYYSKAFSDRTELDFSFFGKMNPIEEIKTIDRNKGLIYSTINSYEFLLDPDKKMENSLRVRNFTGKLIKEIPLAVTFVNTEIDPKFKVSPKGNWLSVWNTRNGAIEIYATSNWKKVSSLAVSNPTKENDMSAGQVNKSVGRFDMAFSEDETRFGIFVHSTFEYQVKLKNDNGEYRENQDKIHEYKLDVSNQTGEKIREIGFDKIVQLMAYNPSNNRLTIVHTDYREYTVEVLDEFGQMDSVFSGSGMVNALKYSSNGKFMALSDLDHVMLYNFEERVKIAGIISFGKGADENQIVISPDGYYFGSQDALKSFAYAYNGKSYPLEQFDLIYNRPDIVIGRIPGHDQELVRNLKAAVVKRGGGQKVRTFNDLISNIPTLAVLGNAPNSADTGLVEISIGLDAGAQHLNLLHVYVNNVSVFGRNGIVLSNKNSIDTTLIIPIASGQNSVELSVVNNIGVESMRRDISVLNNEKKPNPNLYYIGIGAAKYADPSNDLLFVDNDVVDFIELIKDSADIYNSIYDTLLLNEQVTKEAVEGLSAWLSNVTPDDKVIVFYSGHGFIEGNNSYYLGAYDIDPKNPQLAGIPIETMNDLIDGIPVQRKLLLLNACQSGEDDSGKSYHLIKKYFVNLKRDNGAFVISGTGTTGQFAQTAISIEDWDYEENSLFGYMTLQCIREYDAGGVYSLSSYLNKKIAQETFQEQQPKLKHANKKIGFNIW